MISSEINPAQLADLLMARSGIYRLLSDLYSGGDWEMACAKLNEMLPHISSLAEAAGDTGLIDAAERMRKLSVIFGNEYAAYSKMNRAYTRLYLLGSQSLPLYASVWLSPDKEARKEPYFQIRAYYKAFNFARTVMTRESDEFLSVMLLFMAVTAEEAASIATNGGGRRLEIILEAQTLFLKGHLLNWVPALCDKSSIIAEKEELFFYGEAAHLLNAALEFDRYMLENLTDK